MIHALVPPMSAKQRRATVSGPWVASVTWAAPRARRVGAIVRTFWAEPAVVAVVAVSAAAALGTRRAVTR